MSAEPSAAPAQGEIWEGEASVPTDSTVPVPGPAPTPRFKPIDRQQFTWAALDVDQLIPPDHLARAIWEMVGRLNWSRFWAQSKAVEGVAGCTPYDPRLLASLWILAYSEGVGSARAIERRCEYHPAYRWLTGLAVVGHHTLSDFRVAHQERLDELFVQVLTVLADEGLITLERVMQDGTKVAAAASPRSFHREATLRRHLEAAQERVRAMADPQLEESEELSAGQRQAQERAARERLERMEQSLQELEQVRAETKPEGREECRVSETEPEARKMKQPVGGGYAPSYNLQVVTDATEDVIVGVQVVQARNDQQQLEAGLDRLQQQTGVVPKEAVVDEGYLTRATVLEMEQRGVDLISAGQLVEGTYNQQKRNQRGVPAEFFPEAFVYDATRDLYVCPAGQELSYRYEKHDREGVERHHYQAHAAQCRACPHQPQCCPIRGAGRVNGRIIVRTENVPAVAAFVEKMKTPEAQAIYQQRKRIAEFPHLWLKEKLGLRRFHVRGLVKVSCEALWACLTYNLQQWWRLRWRPQVIAPTAAAEG